MSETTGSGSGVPESPARVCVRLIGRLARPVRAGVSKIVWNTPAARRAPQTIALSSDAFGEGGAMPRRFAGHGVGENISPPLRWSGVPADAAELVLVIEDPDVPLPRPIVHGLFTGISARTSEIATGALNLDTATTTGDPIRSGVAAFDRRGYAGPRPIPGHGPHRYVFQLFALDRPSGLGENSTRTDAVAALDGHVIARGMLTGTYERR
ncbi:YbhB/YbcL family Raf kinase inhibitor-like protein [Nocardia miyunensis]|uniref:YbhB/YbcL family Raf kinase inhibitor-like protein n=1 Tax=Nocardia miyunensis TaxID=282684 RepID=UPI0009FEAE3B|nr:YbhB/YbcL family Raf kinase inhibitor-like protein [Nocardia miyunensis]